jgi:DNA-binding PadR family transcriptional regulator
MTSRPKVPQNSPSPSHDGALTSAQFHILLTLAEGQRHGYGIMQEVESRTNGAIELGPGTLYRSIKQLLERGLILEVGHETPDAAQGSGNSKRSYSLTALGKARTAEEAQRLRDLVKWAEDALVLEGGAQ